MLLLVAGTGENLYQFIVVLLIFACVMFACYYTTRFIAGYQKKHQSFGNFKIIDSMRLPGNKVLAIVEVGTDEFFVIGLGKEEITYLGKIDREKLFLKDEDNALTGEGEPPEGRFADILNQFRSRLRK